MSCFLNWSLLYALNNKYVHTTKQKKQIFLKFKWQLINALNIREKNTQKQIKPIFDFYGDSLKDIINNNFDNGVSGKNNFL